MIDEKRVRAYLQCLEEALGDDRKFMPLIESLKSDPDLTQADAVALASKFVAKTAASTARAKAIDRIVARHTALVSFRLKQRAMAGRSAA